MFILQINFVKSLRSFIQKWLCETRIVWWIIYKRPPKVKRK
ncbi:MAG: hypothetical protein ACKERF_01600 [Candidatus Hodgkinia cicadicola]